MFEPEWGGHQEDWVRLLAAGLAAEAASMGVVFLVHPKLYERLTQASGGSLLERGAHRVRLEALERREAEHCLAPSQWRRALARWEVARAHARRLGASHVHFLCIDAVQLPLAFGARIGPGVKVSGILFRPSQHYAQVFATQARAAEHLRELRKRALYSGMLSNRLLARVLTLDPTYSAWARHPKVQYIPDPIVSELAPSAAMQAQVRGRWGVPPNRHLFVLLGALQARKGVIRALQALHHLPRDVLASSAVIMAGRVEEPIRSRLWDVHEQVQRAVGVDGWLRVEDGFLEPEELSCLLYSADTVLAPYQRFVGSSGILSWAALARTPLITQRYGLLGHLATEHGLGLVVDTTDPTAIADAMQRCLAGGCQVDPHGAAAYVAAHQTGPFVRGVAETLAQ
ncbi:MAG: glycosyltransferase [Pseudomonadota bacterium]